MDTPTATSDASGEMSSQWRNPGDIFPLLLLIGGDTVQKALAQLVGIHVNPFKNGPAFGITPVAFSFGWVAYAFMSLMSAAGDHQLMPSSSDYTSIVVDCENAFVRINQSWMLNRLLRDHESANEVDPTRVSLRIDIYHLGQVGTVYIDKAWALGWAVMIVQVIISIIPWALYGNWSIFMITLCGTVLALLTGSLPQWSTEKWAGRTLRVGKRKVTCLTRGNGSFHVMVFIGGPGTWDVEALAAAKSTPRKETTWIIIILAVLWTGLLISASSLKEHTWFLVGVGGIGMLQNVYAAGSPRQPGASNIHLTRHRPRSTIIGIRQPVNDIDNSDDDEDTSQDWLNPKSGSEIGNVMGALMELEKMVPTAGLALLKVFFPGGLKYKKERIRYKVQRKFWKAAFRTTRDRSSAT